MDERDTIWLEMDMNEKIMTNLWTKEMRRRVDICIKEENDVSVKKMSVNKW